MKKITSTIKSITPLMVTIMMGLAMLFSTSIKAQGTIVEDFETGDFSNLNWQFSGTPNSWEIEEVSFGSGIYSASANAIAFNDYVFMNVTRTFTEPSTITFDVQQTENNILIFEIEDVISMYSPGFIVGTGLRQESYDVPAGTYEIRFGSYNIGSFGEPFTMKDSLFIDNISFPNQPFTESAVVQIIHNSSDVLAGVVDIYLNNALVLDDVAYRSATPFIDFPAGQEVTVSVKGPNSTPGDDPLWSNNYTLEAGEKYILIAEGLVVDPSGYDPYKPFDIAVFPQAEQTASSNANVNILVYHGATDAPIVDVIETGVGAGLLVDDISYGEYSGYFEVLSNNYQLSVFDETGTVEVARYYAPLADLELGGSAITVVASGFLNPAVNSDGAAFTLLAATSAGGNLVELPIMSDLEGNIETFETGDFSAYNWRFEGDENSWQISEGGNGQGSFAATAKHDAFNDYQTMYVYGEFEQAGTLELDMLQTENSVTIFEVGDYLISYSQFDPTPDWETVTLDIPAGVQRISITNYVIGFFGEPWTTQDDSVFIDNMKFNSNDQSQTARVQIIHNSAHYIPQTADIYLNGDLLVNDLTYLSATPFIDAPAGEEFTIGISADSLGGVPYWTKNFTLEAGKTYILVATGLVFEFGYDPYQPFDIIAYDMGRESANMSGKTDVLVQHGATDAPTVDVYEMNAGLLADNLEYNAFAGYLELDTQDYVLQVRDETGSQVVASYEAPLETLGLEGEAITVLATGFLDPTINNFGQQFGLWAALASGGALVELPVYDPEPIARVQVIHNSADAAAEVVDVWLDNTLLLDNFTFRNASPFVDAPAGEEFTIAIQGPNSTSPDNPIWSQDYTLAEGETYILVAEGIVSPDGYEPNQPFDIAVYPMAREMANMSDKTDVLVHHGSTDAPTVDVYEAGVGAGMIVDNLAYSDFQGYLELDTENYTLEIRDETGQNTVVTYYVPLDELNLDGAAVTLIASGFLNPENNSNGLPFGLFAVTSSGLWVGFSAPLPQTARVQVIHNSADAAAEVVDVWLDNTLLLDNFAFRTASPFVDAPAGTEFTVAIQGPESTSPANPIWSQNYTLEAGEKYILVADGMVSASGYDPYQPFNIAVYPMGREMATMMNNTDVLVHHGSTDAPIVDIYETGVGAGQIVDDLMYGDFDGYLELPTADYILEIRDETGESTVATFSAPLQALQLEGQAISVIASGFLNPTNNSGGPAFGLYAALSTGGELLPLSITTGIDDVIELASISTYPNPVSDYLNINFSVKESNEISVELINLLGSKMISDELGYVSGNNVQHQINVSDMPEGLYIMTINAGESTVSRKIQIVR